MEQPSIQLGSGRRAAVMLTLVTLFWGLSFPLMKDWHEAARSCPGGEGLASLTLIALRMFLALAVLGMVQPGLLVRPSFREHGIGMLIGTTFFVGFTAQVVGLAWTTPALSAFITSLGSAWVPVVAFFWFRSSLPPVILVGLFLGIGGAGVLAYRPEEFGKSLGPGECLTLLASVIFAFEILLLDRLGRGVDSPHFTMAFLAATGLLALGSALLWAGSGPGWASWWSWTVSMLRSRTIWLALGGLVLLCTVLAFHWMNVYQPRVSAGRAALIYLFEPIFAAIFSVIFGHEQITWQLLLGGGLILGGNLLAEMPLWKRKFSNLHVQT